MENTKVSSPEKVKSVEAPVPEDHRSEEVNASGHKQELERNFNLLSICAIAVTTGNTWIAQGGSVVCCYHPGLWKYCFNADSIVSRQSISPMEVLRV